MKVLLCSPYSVGPQFVQGGVVVWAQNIVNYYKTLSSDVFLEVCPFDRKLRKNSMEEGPLRRAWYGLKDYGISIKNIRSKLNDCQYDLLHLCSSASISLLKDIIVLKIAKRYGVKTVIHFHFGRIPEIEQKCNWEWRLLQKVSRLADVVVTMDSKSHNVLLKKGFKNAHYLPNPLSQGVMQIIEDELASVTRKERLLCFVGHVIPSKGVYELVSACKGLCDIKLHVVGRVTEDVRCQMERISGKGDWLAFDGEVDQQKVIREMLTSSIFVLPSYTEGFPNVILESMACGCAIVTTPVGAIPEMLDIASDAPCGLCCEPKDVDGLRKNIQFFLDNPSEASQYAERAKKRVNEMYDIPKVWEQMVGIWRGVLLR